MNIEVYIDRLVLTGFSYGDRQQIADSIQHELTRILAEKGLPSLAAHESHVLRVDGGAFQVVPNYKPITIGTMAAQAVYKGMNR
jgi:hypothetical protein